MKRTAKWRAENPEAATEYHRRWKLRKKYGLTAADYDRMADAQGGLCAICQQPPRERDVLVVDHDHSTGSVRGLLCGPCNRGLGSFYDRPDVMEAAADYLRRTMKGQTA